jgi:hypothetical protein
VLIAIKASMGVQKGLASSLYSGIANMSTFT